MVRVAHAFVATEPSPPISGEVTAGAFAQVIPVSVQLFPARKTCPPSGLGSVSEDPELRGGDGAASRAR